MDAASIGLIGGAIGVLGTLCGTIFTQVRADSRDQVRLASEERREAQRHRLDAQRSRDARLFDHRRSALLLIIEKYHVYSEMAWRVENRVNDEMPDDDVLEPFWQVLSQVDLYCGKSSAKVARELYMAVSAWLHGTGEGSGSERQARAEAVFEEFLRSARAELGVSDDPAESRETVTDS